MHWPAKMHAQEVAFSERMGGDDRALACRAPKAAAKRRHRDAGRSRACRTADGGITSSWRISCGLVSNRFLT